jgi:hypothetical protein
MFLYTTWSFINTCTICVICYVLKRISSSMLHFSSIIFFIQPMISLNWSWINIYYLYFIHQFKWTLCSRAIFSISGFHSRDYVQGCFTFWGKKYKCFFFSLAVYCVSTPSILLTRIHVTWLVHKWSFINTCAICVICYVLKRISSSMQKVENEEHAFNLFHKLFFCCILSQIYWVESQLRFEFE